MMSMESLESMYKNNYCLLESEIYSLTDLENMIPWERDIYVSLLRAYVEEENKRIDAENAKIKAAASKRKR